MTAPSEIREFKGRWAFLSNFHPAVLTWEGITYPTSEHAFNAGKTLDLDARRDIARAPTPREAKRRGRSRSLVLRAGWDERVRYEVMAEVLHAKFSARQERLDALLSTGDALLVEGNRWHDQHWGNCLCARPACAAPGENRLGKMLMAMRDAFRRQDEGLNALRDVFLGQYGGLAGFERAQRGRG